MSVLTSVTMSDDGSLVIPLEARQALGMEKGGSLQLSTSGDGLMLLPETEDFQGEILTPERKAELLLNNAFTREEWDEIVATLLADGINPTDFQSIDMSVRQTLQTDAEWKALVERKRAERERLEHVA